MQHFIIQTPKYLPVHIFTLTSANSPPHFLKTQAQVQAVQKPLETNKNLNLINK